jgi:hypothetical protein
MNIEWDSYYCEYDTAGDNSVLVRQIHWTCTATEGSDSYQARGSIDTVEQNRVYTLPALQNVPSHVMANWVHQALNHRDPDAVANIEAAVTDGLNEIIAPSGGGLVPN